jgi:CHAD domain-containing protein
LRFIFSIAMAFHFKKTESPAKGVRRVCRERIGAARVRLRQSSHPAAIHDVRRDIKKLRAIFRLVRGEIGRGVYRKGARALRAAARYLTATRDARAMLKAFEKLTGRSTGRFPEVKKALHKHSRKETRRLQKSDSIVLADRALRKTGRCVRDLKIKPDGWAAIEAGLNKSCRHGRSALRLVRREPLPDNFHEWRKHVKDLWFHLRLLHPSQPAKMRVMVNRLGMLGDFLGDDHDLVMLKEFVCEHFKRSEVSDLFPMIDSRQRELRMAALKLGERLFDGKPPVFCRCSENKKGSSNCSASF